MNKERYIKETDAVVPSPEFTEKLSKLPEAQKKKHRSPVPAILAACLALVVIAVPAAGMMNGGRKSADSNNAPEAKYYSSDGFAQDENSFSVAESQGKNKDISTDDRKITKNAQINVDVKNLNDFITTVKNEISKNGGYVSSENKAIYDYSSSCTLVVKIPADKLDEFIGVIDSNSTVTSQQVDSDDISASYADNEAKIKSLETEQETLLKLLEKAESLDNVIQLQDRLTEIRSQLDYLKSMKKMMDNQVEYSSVTIYANESERTIKTDGSFLSQVKEKFLNSIYSIGDFFREFAINFLGAIPYLAIIAVVAVIVIVIIKKRKKKKFEE